MVVIKKIVIFGATGNTGLCSLQSAIELGRIIFFLLFFCNINSFLYSWLFIFRYP